MSGANIGSCLLIQNFISKIAAERDKQNYIVGPGLYPGPLSEKVALHAQKRVNMG